MALEINPNWERPKACAKTCAKTSLFSGLQN